MFDFSSRNQSRRLARLAALILCLAALLPALGSPARAADTPEAAIDKLSAWNVMRGYPDGQYHPERSITRAEFVALVNRAYGHTEVGPTPFTDVPADAWFADDIAIAYNAGYFTGTSPTTASPGDSLSREQALVLLARNMRLEEIPGEVTAFTDGRDFAPYSKGYVNAAVHRGLIGGFDDDSFLPRTPITRGQMAIMLTNAVGTLVPQSGTHVLGNVFGSLTLNQPDTTLQDTTVTGDLYISGGLDLGAVTLDNVQVLGDIIVAGGGDSEAGEDSVVLRNVDSDGLIVDSLNRQPLSLRAEGDTLIPKSNIRSDAFIQDQTRSGYGLLNLTLDGSVPNTQYTLSGRLKDVWNLSPSSSLTISKGSADSLTIDEKALGSQLTVDTETTVKELNLDIGIPVSGTGDISKLNVNATGSSTTILPDKIQVRPGLTASVAGEVMDTKLAEESSTDPRLLAGYPEARNIAPTSLTAVFSGNKTGTVYWAVSAITDGSIGEDNLISPPTYNSKAVKGGNVKLTASSTEMPVNISGLTSGGSYYLSAVMTDARGARSPLKVISFTTPDNTTPAFSSGYPKISRLKTNADRTASAQIAVMATKTCDLYYAVMPKGASAPTVNDFKTAYVPGNKGFGVQKLTKNSAQYVTVSDSLTELTDYDLYLWLTDADGAKSSAVKRLSFKTPDGTPPEFRPHPSILKEETRTLTYTCGVTEGCTVYWTAVRSGTDYPKAPADGGVLTPGYAQRVIMSGSMGSPERSGKVTAKADAGITLRITGLQPATAYDIYYIAVDPAGNISPVNLAAKVGSFMVTGHTVDNEPPTVTQEFGYYSGGLPYVRLIFSEDVRQKTIEQSATPSFQQLYNNVAAAQTDAQKKAAKDTLASTLKSTITLYNAATGEAMPARTNDGQAADKWVIDYRNATVHTNADGTVTLQFAATSDALKDSALNLSSGGSYFFRLIELEDLSSNHNPLVPARQDYVQTPNFTTSRATVTLTNLNGYGKTITVDNKPIESDVHFTLTPRSTSTADDTTAWDMLIWNNHNLEYQLYRRVRPNTGSGFHTDWELVENPRQVSFQSSNNRGKSLTWSFLGAAQPGTLPGDAPQGAKKCDVWGLTDQGGAVYEYVIHVVSIDGNADRDSWAYQTDPVKFEVEVLAGSPGGLQDIGVLPTKENYGQQMTAHAGDISKISVLENGDAEKPFTVTVPFQSHYPPHFLAQSPRITPDGTTINFNYNLDRAATIHYWIVPLPNEAVRLTDYILPRTVANKDNTLLPADAPSDRLFSKDNYKSFYAKIPTAGISSDKFESFSGNGYVYYPLEEPSVYFLQNPDIDPSSVEYKYTITGTIGPSTSGTTPIEAPTGKEILPDTDYIMYIALESADGMTSLPQAFKFHSGKLERPLIMLSRPKTSTAGIRNMRDTDSITIECALVRTDANSTAGGLLREELEWPVENENWPGTTDKKISLLKALTTNYIGASGEEGSLFDQWISKAAPEDAQEYINNLAFMVQSGTGDDVMDGVVENYQISLPLRNGSQYTTVPCEGDMSPGASYYFICMAKNTKDTSTSNTNAAFKAWSTLFITMEKAPRVDSVFVDVYDSASADGICGEITLSLNTALYNMRTVPDEDAPWVQAINMSEEASGDAEEDPIGIGQLPMTGSKIFPKYDDEEDGPASQDLTFYFGTKTDDGLDPITEGTYQLLIRPYGSGVFSTSSGGATNPAPLRITLVIQSEAVNGKIVWTATASIDTTSTDYPDSWGHAQGSSSASYTPPAEYVTGLTILDIPDVGSLNMKVGETRQVSAHVTPENATNKHITWHTTSPSILLAQNEDGTSCTIYAQQLSNVAVSVILTASGAEPGKTVERQIFIQITSADGKITIQDP